VIVTVPPISLAISHRLAIEPPPPPPPPLRILDAAPRRPLPPPPPAPTQTTYAIFSPGCFVQVPLLVYSRMM
jgi:hypothetical protein